MAEQRFFRETMAEQRFLKEQQWLNDVFFRETTMAEQRFF